MDNLKQIKLDRIVSSISMCPPPKKTINSCQNLASPISSGYISLQGLL